jgi:hypothetical protein
MPSIFNVSMMSITTAATVTPLLLPFTSSDERDSSDYHGTEVISVSFLLFAREFVVEARECNGKCLQGA